MKRHFLSAFAIIGGLAAAMPALQAQQETSSSNDKVIVVTKTQNSDGTFTVTKKSIAKGQDIETVVKELEIEQVTQVTVDKSSDNGTVTEIIIVTDGEPGNLENTENDETVLIIRSGNDHQEIKWRGAGPGEGFHHKRQERQERTLVNDMPEKAFLGVTPETAEEGGVLFSSIVEGSGAEAAGLQAGDILKTLDGEEVLRHADLTRMLAERKPGDVVNLLVSRNGDSFRTSAELTGKRQHHWDFDFKFDFQEPQRDPCKVFIGVYVGSYGENGEGVEVSGVIPGWPAEEAGLQAGDRIVALDGKPVDSHSGLVLERDKHEPGDRFTIKYIRDGKTQEVKARFKDCPSETELTEEAQPVPASPIAPQQLDNTLNLSEFGAYPNPTFGELNVNFKGEAVPTVVRVTDVNGKLIYEEELPNFDGYYNRQLDLAKANPGTLLLSVQQAGKVQSKPIVLLNRA